jgi:hypothetical protein
MILAGLDRWCLYGWKASLYKHLQGMVKRKVINS